MLFLYLYAMTFRELNVLLQQQNASLIATLDSLTKTIEKQSQELASLKAIILEKNKFTDKLK